MSEKLKVFISWSGDESRHVAEVLAKWIESIVQSAKTWMSSRDIQSGKRWSTEIAGELEQTSFAVVCVTPGNKTAPWLHFEAGAASKKLDEAQVVPYLIGLQPSDVGAPLSLFHMEVADFDGTLRLFKAVALAAGTALDEDLFESVWPKIEAALDERPESPSSPKLEDETAVARETLLIVRNLATSIDVIRSTLERGISAADPDVPFEQRILGRVMESFFTKGLENPENLTKVIAAMQNMPKKAPSPPAPGKRRNR